MGKKRYVERIKRANASVALLGLDGYISADELKLTLYNAAIKSGAFNTVHLYNNFSSNVSLDAAISDIVKKDLRLFIGSGVSRVSDNTLYLERLYDNSKYTGYRYFEIIKDSQRMYTGENSALCYHIEWVDKDNRRTVVADVIYPNIVILRSRDIVYGGFTQYGNKHISSFKALSYIVKDAVNALSCTKREFVSRIITSRKEKLINLMYDQLNKTADKVRQKIQKSEDIILEHKRQIQEIEITLESDKKQLEAYDNLAKNLMDKFIREADIIRNIKQVTAVDEYSNIDRGIISVDVADIRVKCQRQWYYLGNYTININLSDKTVRFINTSGILRNGYWSNGPNHHPHCDGNGRPCLGNISTQVVELIGSMDLAFLVNLCISYLQSVNIRDAAGCHIVNWPLCNEHGVIISEKNEHGLYRCRVCKTYMPEIDNDDWEKCADCGEWMCPTHTTSIEVSTGTIRVCTDCFLNYKLCPSCGKYELKDLFKECPVCGDSVCPSCASDKIEKYAYFRNRRIDFMCNKHHVHKCEGCGLVLVETDSCPSCDLGQFSVGVCALCGETVPEDLFREDYFDICIYCNTDNISRCSVCGRYDRNENLEFDVVTGEHRHSDDCGGDPFDIDDITEPDAGVIELQRGYIENGLRNYIEDINVTANDDWIDYAVEELRTRIFDTLGVPQNIIFTADENTATRTQVAIAEMVAEALAQEEAERVVAEGENTPLPEGIREFYNQPVVDEEALPFPDGIIDEEPIVDNTITG